MPIAWEKYRHYKSTGWNDHTYEVIWIAKHSETEDIMVVYKPLFHAEDTRLWDCQYAVRPLPMREEEVVYNGNIVKRFTKIG